MTVHRAKNEGRKWAQCLAALLLAFALLGSAAAWADDDFDAPEIDPDLPLKIKAWNADCLSCHSKQGLTNPPRKGMDMALLAKLLVEQERFEHSDHGKMACKDCHGEPYVPYPHLPNAKKQIKDCVSCHQNPAKVIVPEFKASIHFKEHSDKFTCLSCHDQHNMRKGTRLGAPRHAAAQDNGVCRDCHDDARRYDALKAKGKRKDIADSHDWLPQLDRHLSQVRCVDCHSPVADVGALSHDVQAKDKAERQCEACHGDDTALAKRLFKPMVRDNPNEWAGFANAAWLREIYVVGANGNAWLEWGGLAALIATAIAVFIRRRK